MISNLCLDNNFFVCASEFLVPLLHAVSGTDILVYPSQSISDMKNRMKDCHDMPADLFPRRDIRLMHEKRELEDDQLISNYNICDGSKIVVEKQLQIHVSIKAKKGKRVCF